MNEDKNKTLNLSLTPLQAVILWRMFSTSYDISVTPEVNKYFNGERPGYSSIADKARLEINNSGDHSIWGKLDSILVANKIEPRTFTAQESIKIANEPVEFLPGAIRVGCTKIPNEVVKEIFAKLIN